MFVSSQTRLTTIFAGLLSGYVSGGVVLTSWRLMFKRRVAKFQYTFCDAFGMNNSVPEMPITPFPTLFNTPIYRSQSNTLEMMAANFFYMDPKTKTQMPLDVYIGNIGPLRLRIYNHSPLAMDGRFDPSMPFIPVPPLPNQPGVPVIASDIPHENKQADVVLSLPARHLHMMIVAEMPPMPDILKALREDALPAGGDIVDKSQDASSGRGGNLMRDIAGRSLPLLFIRSYDGVGYHSGRVIAADNVLHAMDLSNPARSGAEGGDWLAAAQAAARMSDDTSMHGWNLKVL